MSHELVIRDGWVREAGAVVDVAVDGGRIVEVGEVLGDGDEEIDAGGNLVSPGFVDCHKYVDRAFAAAGERVPVGHDEPFPTRGMDALFDAYFAETPRETVTDRAVEDVLMAVRAGTTHVRTHVGVDHSVGAETMAACLDARDRLSDVVDLQLVPMAGGGLLEPGGTETVREALEMGLDRAPGDVLLGGVDPATRSHDVERTIETWFDLATEYDVDLDVHVQDGGYLGVYTIGRLAEHARERGYEGRVTVSHGFSLAQVPAAWWLEDVIADMADAGMDLVTCFNSIRASMPIEALVEGGVPVGHGTDNDHDFVISHGSADSLDAARIVSLKLHGEWRFGERYRWSESNPFLDRLWDLVTTGGAEVLGLADHGVREGARADLVVLDEPSPQWAILRRAARTHVIKDGAVVARDGEMVPEFRPE